MSQALRFTLLAANQSFSAWGMVPFGRAQGGRLQSQISLFSHGVEAVVFRSALLKLETRGC